MPELRVLNQFGATATAARNQGRGFRWIQVGTWDALKSGEGGLSVRWKAVRKRLVPASSPYRASSASLAVSSRTRKSVRAFGLASSKTAGRGAPAIGDLAIAARNRRARFGAWRHAARGSQPDDGQVGDPERIAAVSSRPSSPLSRHWLR